MMKKFTALLASLLLVFSLASCGESGEEAQETTVQTEEVTESESEVTTTQSETTVKVQSETEAEETAQEEVKETEDNYKELYKEVLYDFMESENYSSDSMFDLYDMDNDSIPELFISSNDYHAAEVCIYTIYNNEAVEMGEFGSWGVARVCDYYLESGFSNGGEMTTIFYSKEKDKLTELINFADYSESISYYEKEYLYFINESPVTKEEYNKEYNKYDSENWVEVGRKYILDESGINEAFGY